MSKPDLEPKRTLAGITVDPKTLERVIPESRRADGSVRKQLKIRPGFTPQEDVKLFRSTRQQQAERNKLPAGHIPGWAPPSSGSGSRLGSVPGSGSGSGAGVGAGVPGAGDGAGGTKSKNAAKKAKQKAKKQADKQAALDKIIAENWDDSTDEEPSTTTAAAAATTTKSKSKEQKSVSTSEEKSSEVKEESKKESTTTTAAAVPSVKDNSKADGGSAEGDALADELKEKLNV
ncbi:rna binding protein [Pyrrhoderma noxium]|uniref:Rna binding protein n=1 Tax=Pyrrhoderma noxium TaxID=2282107 RepID=A0A286UNA0_9AGAM|nr:rna binding protein [Pyrrhoderma noxium]